jgi:hypothetical protein
VIRRYEYGRRPVRHFWPSWSFRPERHARGCLVITPDNHRLVTSAWRAIRSLGSFSDIQKARFVDQASLTVHGWVRLVRLLRIGDRHIRLYIRVVIGNFPLAAILYQHLQQTRTKAPLLVSIRSGKQLLNSSHRGEHFYNSDIWSNKLD